MHYMFYYIYFMNKYIFIYIHSFIITNIIEIISIRKDNE